MKLLFISDIHGLKTNLDYIDKIFNKEQCDKLVILGDILYLYESRLDNKDYDQEAIINFLDKYKDKLICIRGNCDIGIYEKKIPVALKDIDYIEIDGIKLYVTHGHIYNSLNWDKTNSILIYGHEHIPYIKEKNGNIFINPGSISLPRRESNPSYMIYDNKTFTIYDVPNKKTIATITV